MDQIDSSFQIRSIYNQIQEGKPTQIQMIRQDEKNQIFFWKQDDLPGTGPTLQDQSISYEEDDQILVNPDSSLQQNSNQFQIEENQSSSESEQLPKKTAKKPKKNKGKKKKSIKKDISGETKNIPKNYGKQIIKFSKMMKQKTEMALKGINSKFTYDQLMKELKIRKKKLNKIQDLRKLWISEEFSREFRVLSNQFLRKHCLNWIFNSRIENIKHPLKYKYKIEKGVKNPEEFISLKQY